MEDKNKSKKKINIKISPKMKRRGTVIFALVAILLVVFTAAQSLGDITVTTVFADIKPRQTYDGEAKSFMLNAKIWITVDAVCDNELPIICDAYSSKFDVDINSENVSISNMLDSIDEKYSCKKNIKEA